MGMTGLGTEVVEVVMRIRFEREDTLWLFMIMILVYSPVMLYSIGHSSSVWMQVFDSNGLHTHRLKGPIILNVQHLRMSFSITERSRRLQTRRSTTVSALV